MPTAAPAPVPLPVPAATGAPPEGLLDANITGLLTGQVAWSRELGTQLVHWLWGTGWTLLLAVVLAWLGLRAWDAVTARIFGLVSASLKPDSAVRLAQRINTSSAILRSVGKVVIVFLAAMVVLSRMGVNVAPILASAGIVGLAVGFGAQSLVKDVISGFFIIMEDQYGVGDVIQVGESSGLVEKMNLRITQIRNQHGSLITIPNGAITTVTNHSKEWARAVLEVGISYHEDPDRVMQILRELGEELQAELPDKVVEPVEILGVEAFKESEVVIKLQFKTAPLEQWAVSRAFRRKVWFKFKENGIEIPFPQRTLWLATAGENKGASALLEAVLPRPEEPGPGRPAGA